MRVLHNPAGRILDILQEATVLNQRKIIALAGYPGCGKTTITQKWRQMVDGKAGAGAFIVLGMDGFHLSKKELSQLPDPHTALVRRGAPFTFNPAGLAAQLRLLRSGFLHHEVGWPGFQHEIGDPVEDALIIPKNCRVLLLEGIYTLLRQGEWAALEDCIDESWFLNVSIETSMERLYIRHQRAFGLNPDQAPVNVPKKTTG